jgi:transcriptional regulator with PAS, ATPase and Fis domain
LNVFAVTLPPLRERMEDVPIIAQQFLAEQTRDYQKPKFFADDALVALQVHRWPGNVRELKNVIERAAILSADAPEVRAEHLMIQRRITRTPEERVGEILIPPEGKTMEDIQREAVAITLRLTHGNRAAAARLLGISRPTLAKRASEAKAAGLTK